METIFQLFPNFLLVFCRITSFFVVAPIFSARNVPTQFKIGLSFFIAFITFTLIGGKPMTFDGVYLLALIKEVLIGVLLGFVAYVFFSIVQIAGSFMDLQMGFSIANVIDPMTGAQSPIMGNFKFMLAVLLFLGMNGHHYFIQAIVDSYKWVPLDSGVFTTVQNGQLAEFLLRSFADTFSIAFRMAAPIVASLFVIDAGLGILARTAPQFNIFVLGMPLKIVVGFLLLSLLIPGYYYLFQDVFSSMLEAMQKLLLLLSAK